MISGVSTTHHGPRGATCTPSSLPALAPIGNRIDRHIEQLGCGLRTIAPIATLPAGTGRRPQWAATLHAIGIAQPIDLAGRKRTALPTAVALLIETLGNLDIGMIWGQLPIRSITSGAVRRTTYSRFGPRDFQRTTGLGLPAHIDANGLL